MNLRQNLPRAQSNCDQLWLAVLRRYLAYAGVGNLLWEIVHLPLYTIWTSGSVSERAFAALHCAIGDILIALATVMLALFVVGSSNWPAQGRGSVLVLTILFGVGYTIFSESLNIDVRAAWAYSDLMPVIPVVGVGLSPVLQWLVIPFAAYSLALRRRAPITKRGAADNV